MINNLGTRSALSVDGQESTVYPILDSVGTHASYFSCFATDKASMGGNEMVLTFDLGKSYFVHSVLYTADIWGES